MVPYWKNTEQHKIKHSFWISQIESMDFWNLKKFSRNNYTWSLKVVFFTDSPMFWCSWLTWCWTSGSSNPYTTHTLSVSLSFLKFKGFVSFSAIKFFDAWTKCCPPNTTYLNPFRNCRSLAWISTSVSPSCRF